MTDLYHGYPVFIWQALLNLSSLVIAGLLIAFVTTFYLKRKDESIRVAGVILEKRVNVLFEPTFSSNSAALRRASEL